MSVGNKSGSMALMPAEEVNAMTVSICTWWRLQRDFPFSTSSVGNDSHAPRHCAKKGSYLPFG